MSRVRVRSAVTILSVLFTATGFVGLVTEQVYEKLLSTLLGASTPAAATVLAAYFTGLTLGAASYERGLRRRIQNPIRVYSLLEGGVAVLLVITMLLFDKLLPLFAPILSAARGSMTTLQIARLIVAAIWILPPTFLMGASLPAIADSIAMLRVPSRHRFLAAFYTLNLLGAIAASVLAPYALFPLFGLDGALTICAAIGGAVCLTAQRMSRSWSAARWQSREAEALAAERTRESTRGVILLLAFASGFLFFGLEVLWVHLLAAVIGNSVYAFATMLTVVLISLAIGSGISVLILRPGEKASWAFVGAVMFAAGMAMTATYGLWPTIPHSLAIRGAAITSFGWGELLRFRHALTVLLLPATILGIWFPSLFRLPDFPAQGFGDFVGKTYAVNAVGCVTGALAMSFLLLPRFGSEMLLSAFAMILVAGGVLLIAWRRSSAWPLAIVIGLAALLIVKLPAWDRLRLTSGEHVYFAEGHVLPESRLLFYREDPAGGIVTVVGRFAGPAGKQRFVRTLLTNGKFEGSDGDEEIAQTGFALVPALLTRDFNDALVIGGGTGATADVVHALGFRNVRVAEIVPTIIDAAREQFSGLNHRVFDEPNVKLDVEDGRNVLLLDRQATYDLITIEISSIWFANATNLYSREFYRVARARMRPHAVLQQWIQLHHIEPYDVLSVIATMRSVFPYVSVWSVGGQGILVGSEEPQVIRANALQHIKLLSPRMGWTSSPQFAASVLSLSRTQTLSPAAVDRMFARVAPIVNTDRNRFLEYSTPRSNLNRAATIESMLQRMESFSDHAAPPIERQALPLLQP